MLGIYYRFTWYFARAYLVYLVAITSVVCHESGLTLCCTIYDVLRVFSSNFKLFALLYVVRASLSIYNLFFITYNGFVITLFKAEIRIPLAVAFFICIIVSIIFKDELGVFSAICFALASLILFYMFGIMPHKLKQELEQIKDDHHPIYRRIAQRKMTGAKKEHFETVNLWFGAAIVLIVVGIIAVFI